MTWLMNLLFGIFKILKNSTTQQKFNLLYFWLKIKLLCLFPETQHLKKINLLNFKVNYISANALRYLVEEIFIHHVYKFKTDLFNPFIIDAGTNIGLSILYFKHYYPECEILSFEADPKTYEIALKNVLENGLQNVTLKNLGLWNSKSKITFYVADSNAPASLNQSFFLTSGRPVEVDTTLLSSFLTKPVDFLKMDIEGAEKNVFEDLDQNHSLLKIKCMSIECHLGDRTTANLQYLLKIMEKNNFLVKIGAHSLLNIDFDQAQDCMVYAKGTQS